MKGLHFKKNAALFEKNAKKVWWFQNLAVPLHPQIRNDAHLLQ